MRDAITRLHQTDGVGDKAFRAFAERIASGAKLIQMARLLRRIAAPPKP
ncbi:hypothetical protein [Acidithiobacillus sulfuriphilus]|uniref:Uncharacterized protein n=1 Tax=Acidithiobacillus sulfuriphilus TaxID=1867749 RepID=A0ACD5HRL9_9PROT|nr:hypothetical protein [Acidithiobacillus sulfuriphilus]